MPETASRNAAIMSAVAFAALSRTLAGSKTTRRVAAGATVCTTWRSWTSSADACQGEAEPARVVTTWIRAAGSRNMRSNAAMSLRMSVVNGPAPGGGAAGALEDCAAGTVEACAPWTLGELGRGQDRHCLAAAVDPAVQQGLDAIRDPELVRGIAGGGRGNRQLEFAPGGAEPGRRGCGRVPGASCASCHQDPAQEQRGRGQVRSP